MSVKYLETDITDEGSIYWYSVDGKAYGFTSVGKILDSGGVPMAEGPESLDALAQVARYEAAK